MFTHPDRDALDDGDRRRRQRYPQNFRIVCSAGEPLNPEAIRWFREQYGVTVLDYYGLTESYPLCANYPFMEVREGSMGKPMPGWDVQILDEDEQPGRRRASAARSACARARTRTTRSATGATRRRARRPSAATGSTPRTPPRMDEDGYVWYAGRADDVIIAAGYRIGPFEVESACLEHPAVAEAAAVASPDERRGNVVKAFIVLAEGTSPPTSSPRRSRPSSATASRAYAYPRRIEFVDELPKTLTGKIRRIELREARHVACVTRPPLPRTRCKVTVRRRGAMGECDARTQGARIAALFGQPRTPQRAVQRVTTAPRLHSATSSQARLADSRSTA